MKNPLVIIDEAVKIRCVNEKCRSKSEWWTVKSASYFERSAEETKDPLVIIDEAAKIR